MKKTLTHIIWAAVAVAAFAGGIYYGRVSAPSPAAGQFAGAGAKTFVRNGLGGRGANGGGLIAGQVVAKDAESLTIALPNGSSQIVFYSTSTSVEKPAPASVNDLSTGTDVLVSGTQNADGSLTAQSIQVRP